MVPKAIHLSGGNYFNNVKIEIAESIRLQDEWIESSSKISIKQSRVKCYARRRALHQLMKLNLYEPMIESGFIRGWFDEFSDYWRRSLGGRPLKISDFFSLRFEYRKKAQYTQEFNWSSAKQHLRNYQSPENINSIFHFVIKNAYSPIREARIPDLISPGSSILEFGCGLAPLYRAYRNYFSFFDCKWYLADIPGFPFHYSRHVYGQDNPVSNFITIEDDNFMTPLENIDTKFDIIFIQEVFEHLLHPLEIARHLTSKLKAGGLLYFDYVKSDGLGHDTPMALEQRTETLKYLLSKFHILDGNLKDPGKDFSLSIGRKKQ